jgi:hypothetical protein
MVWTAANYTGCALNGCTGAGQRNASLRQGQGARTRNKDGDAISHGGLPFRLPAKSSRFRTA